MLRTLTDFVDYLMGVRYESPIPRTNWERLDRLDYSDITDTSAVSGKRIFSNGKNLVMYDPQTDEIISAYGPLKMDYTPEEIRLMQENIK